ncbi:MAG TPA: CRTAC1 family protein [Gemmataceae bacterium]
MSAVAHIKRYKSGEFFKDGFRGDLSWNGYERKVLMRNEGIGANGVPRFSEVAMATGCDDVKDGRGMAVADFDNDGALDLIVNNNPGDCGCDAAPATLLRNNVGAKRSWLAVELVGVTCNRDAVGAEVLAEIDPAACAGRPHLAKQLRLVSAGCSYASQHSSRLYFGLDDLTHVDRLTVRWPGGGEETFADVPARRLVRITQGRGIEVTNLPAKRPAKHSDGGQ